MKTIIIALSSIFILTQLDVYAETNSHNRRSRPTRAEKASGGLVFSDIDGKAVEILNLQDHISDDDIKEAVENVMLHIKVPIRIKRGNKNNTENDEIKKTIKNENTAATIVISKEDKPYSIVYYPERNLCIINAMALIKNASKAKIKDRAFKQIWRGIGMVLGAGETTSKHSILQKVKTMEELDAITARLPTPNQHNKMVNEITGLGMKMIKAGTYRTACMRGWAKEPTTPEEIKIWNEVHSIPKNPMKIKYQKKK